MSVDFICVMNAKLAEIFDGRLSKYGLMEKVVSDKTNEKSRCISDGVDELWIYSRGLDQSEYSCRDANSVVITVNLHRDFQGTVYGELDYQFWGFDSEYEYQLWQAGYTEDGRDSLYSDLIEFLSLKSHNINRDSLAFEQMLIAHELIVRDPTLLDKSRKSDLFRLIDELAIERERARDAAIAERANKAKIAEASAKTRWIPQTPWDCDDDIPF